MKFIAWDTSSRSGTIATFEEVPSGDRPSADRPSANRFDESVRMVSELTLNVDATHSERLLWGIHMVLEASKWTLEDIDFFGVGLGPGSFTSLRIGISTARTLAHVRNKPIVGVSSLALLARPLALCLDPDCLVIAATDACKGQLFALWGNALSVRNCVTVPDLWAEGVREEVLAPERLVQAVLAQLDRNRGWATVGLDGMNDRLVLDLLPKERRIDLPLLYRNAVQGRYLGMLVWEAFRARLQSDALSVRPRYLRASEAEVKLSSRLAQ